MEASPDSAPGAFTTPGHAVLFGFPPQDVEVVLQPRSRGWRMAGAAAAMGVGLMVAAGVAIIPPHAPWVVGALSAGGVFARRRWTEHFTLLDLKGNCPKCGQPLDIKAGRLQMPHPLTCEACHHQSTLQLPDGTLESHRADADA